MQGENSQLIIKSWKSTVLSSLSFWGGGKGKGRGRSSHEPPKEGKERIILSGFLTSADGKEEFHYQRSEREKAATASMMRGGPPIGDTLSSLMEGRWGGKKKGELHMGYLDLNGRGFGAYFFSVKDGQL